MSSGNILSQAKTKKIKVKKTSSIKPTITKINPQKSQNEIQKITKMLSECQIDDNNKSPTPIKKNNKRKAEDDLKDLTDNFNLSIEDFIPLDLSSLPNQNELEEEHIGIVPISLDLKLSSQNYQNNKKKRNISTLYPLYTRFLFTKKYPPGIDIFPVNPENSNFDIKEHASQKWGLDECNIIHHDLIKVHPQIKLYLLYINQNIKIAHTIDWKVYTELYNHIEESFNYHQDYITEFENQELSKKIKMSFEDNPYQAIISNIMSKSSHVRNGLVNLISEKYEPGQIRLGHFYQNIKDNYEKIKLLTLQ